MEGGCTLGATGLEDFSPSCIMHKMHNFNGCFDPQYDLQLIAGAKRGFIETLHQQVALYRLHLNNSLIEVHEKCTVLVESFRI